MVYEHGLPERRSHSHAIRMALRAADAGDGDIAKALATWEPRAKDVLPPVSPPAIKDAPMFRDVESQTDAVDQAFRRAIEHLYAVEDGQAQHIGMGMRTHALAAMLEVFNMSADDIRQDEGALSDLTEYLIAMVDKENGVYLRSEQPPVFADDPDIALVQGILNTWDLPDREFDEPAMYSRVDWVQP